MASRTCIWAATMYSELCFTVVPQDRSLRVYWVSVFKTGIAFVYLFVWWVGGCLFGCLCICSFIHGVDAACLPFLNVFHSLRGCLLVCVCALLLGFSSLLPCFLASLFACLPACLH